MDATQDDLVFEAVNYRRHVGADPASIRSYLKYREPEEHSAKDDRAALDRLERAGRVVRVGKRWFLSPGAYRQARGAALAPEFKPEDAWILLALLARREAGPSTLTDIIVVADWINHAIPTLEELHGALNRLAAARLIQSRNETFEVTDKARDLFAKVEQACRRRVLEQMDCLRRIMICPCCGPQLKSVRWSIGLTEERVESAYQSYRAVSRAPSSKANRS